MKENILKIINELEYLEIKYSFRELETATYIFMRAGQNKAEDMTEEQIKKLDEYLITRDGSIFDEELNIWSDVEFGGF